MPAQIARRLNPPIRYNKGSQTAKALLKAIPLSAPHFGELVFRAPALILNMLNAALAFDSTNGPRIEGAFMGQLQHIGRSTNDSRIRNRIRHSLAGQHFRCLKQLEVEVDHGLVTISGTVKSYYLRQVALSTCQNLSDVITVIDMVTVNE